MIKSEFFPTLTVGWLNGWLLLVIFFSIFGILLKTCPKEVISRLYDKEGWTKMQYVSTKISKILGLIHIILVIFTPLNIGSIEFLIGLTLFLIGTIGFILAIINF